MTTNINEAIATFIETAQASVNEYWAENGYTFPAPVISLDTRGRKYARIVTTQHGDNRSVYCFIDKTNGDVLRAGGWKAPSLRSRGRRGNVFQNNYAGFLCGTHGPAYL